MTKTFVIYATVFLLLVVGGTGCGPSGVLIQPAPIQRQLQETQIQRDRGMFVTDKIAVIDVDGFMVNKRRTGFLHSGDNPVSLFVEKLDKARNDTDVKAVVLRINSPGGTVAASDMMYHKLSEFKKKSQKPVVACMLGVAASGAYYLACGCDGIVAQPSTVTGSIGTIMQTFSFAGTMQKLGIKSVAIKSGKLKDIGSPLHDLSEEEQKLLHAIIMRFHNQFLEVVLDGRKQLEPQKLKQLADGRVFTADEAREENLVDRIGYPSDAIAWAKEMAQVRRARVVIYHRHGSYKANIYGSAAAISEKAGALINVQLPDWLTSNGTQFLYLWQPAIE